MRTRSHEPNSPHRGRQLTRLAHLMNRPGSRIFHDHGSEAEKADQRRVSEALEYMARKESSVSMRDLKYIRKLGEGGFATVELHELKVPLLATGVATDLGAPVPLPLPASAASPSGGDACGDTTPRVNIIRPPPSYRAPAPAMAPDAAAPARRLR